MTEASSSSENNNPREELAKKEAALVSLREENTLLQRRLLKESGTHMPLLYLFVAMVLVWTASFSIAKIRTFDDANSTTDAEIEQINSAVANRAKTTECSAASTKTESALHQCEEAVSRFTCKCAPNDPLCVCF